MSLDQAMGEAVENPIRTRLNAHILTDLFHKGDQRMLLAFSDLPVDSIPVEGYEPPEAPVRKESELAVEGEEPKEEEEPEKEELPEEVRLASDITVSLYAADGVDPETYDFEFSLNDP